MYKVKRFTKLEQAYILLGISYSTAKNAQQNLFQAYDLTSLVYLYQCTAHTSI